MPKLYTNQELIGLGESLISFCKQPHVFHLVQWTRDKERSYDWWLGLMEHHPMLTVYHKRAKEILGGKIVQLAFENGDTWAMRTFIPMYLKDVDTYIKEQVEHEISAKERAKRAGDDQVRETASELVDTMKEYIEKNNDKSSE